MEDTILETLRSLFKQDLDLALIEAEAGNSRRLVAVQVCQQLAASAHAHGQDLTVSKWQNVFGSHNTGGGLGKVEKRKVGNIAALTTAWNLDWKSTSMSPGTLLTLVEYWRKAGRLEEATREIRGKMTVEEVRDALKAGLEPKDPVQDRVDYIVKNKTKLTEDQRATLLAALA